MKNLLELIIKEKKIVLYSALSAFALFLFYLIFFYKPLYASSAKIFIKDIPHQNIIADLNQNSFINSKRSYGNPLFNSAQVLKSKNTSARVLAALKQKNEKDIRKINVKNEDEWHNYLSSHIKTKIIPSTDTLSISLNWTNKDTAVSVLNEIIEQFKEENIDLRKAVATNQRKFLDENLVEISNRLTEVRKMIKNYTIANNAVNMEVEEEVLVASRVELERDIEITKSKINYYDRKYREFAEQIGISDVKVALRTASLSRDPYMENLFINLALSQQKFAGLNSVFTENYPKVIAAKNEIRTLDQIIKEKQNQAFQSLSVKGEEVRGVYGESSQAVVKEMSLARAEKLSLLNQIKEMENGLKKLRHRESMLPEKILGLEELRKQENALKNVYESIKTRQIETTLLEKSVVNNIFILDAPSKPVFLIHELFLKFVGFVYLGLIVGIAAAWVKNYIEENINVNELEHFAI